MNDVAMAWSKAGSERVSEAHREAHQMMLWASVLSSKQYVKMPMHDVLSNLVMLKAHHEAATPALTRPWPEESTLKQPARIGIVSLCSYDAANTSMTALSADNKLRYARHHGYELFFETRVAEPNRPIAWSKLAAVRQHLGSVDWLAWVDCDTLFTNFSRPLHHLLPRDDDAGGDPEVNLIVSEDALMVNTGVFMLRNCEWSFKLLDSWWGPDESPFVELRLWDQGMLQYLLSRAHRRALLSKQVCAQQLATILHNHPEWAKASDSLDLLAHLRLVPQQWINPYPYDLAYNLRFEDAPSHAVATAADLVWSLSGCMFTYHGNWTRCNAMLEEVYQLCEREQ